ncbi:MAG: helix-turn-helix transcriptional regulator [Candidatus Woesebacteria bacterium]|jgi:transcriptional regulator with XRE-family HTH domain
MKPDYNLDDRHSKDAEKKEFAKLIGQRLHKIRIERNISQEQLSEKAGYYRTFIGHIENSTRSPSMHTIWRIANALGIKIKDITEDL